MRRLLKKKSVKIVLILALALLALIIGFQAAFGLGEITQFNLKSMTDWGLGQTVEGLDSPERGEHFVSGAFVWFEADGKCGLKNSRTGTEYTMSFFPSTGKSRFCVTGFSTGDKVYSVMGVRVGDDELETKTALMKSGYAMVGAGFNTCVAVKGSVVIELIFDRGTVTHITAYINK